MTCRGPRGADDRRRQAGHRPGNVSRAFPRGRVARGDDRRRGLTTCRRRAARAAVPVVSIVAAVPIAGQRVTVPRARTCRPLIDAGQRVADVAPIVATVPRSPGNVSRSQGLPDGRTISSQRRIPAGTGSLLNRLEGPKTPGGGRAARLAVLRLVSVRPYGVCADFDF